MPIKGKKNDGNKIITEAKKRGAVLAIVERKNLKAKIPQIKVRNTHLALIQLAKYVRLKSYHLLVQLQEVLVQLVERCLSSYT